MTDIRKEAKTYKDIVVLDFMENYKGNMTLKTFVTMYWAALFYETNFFIKVDDDTLVNLNKIYGRMDSYYKNNTNQEFVMGKCWVDIPPERNPKNKWFISTRLYPAAKYPRTPQGPCFSITRKAILSLLMKAPDIPVITIDDVSIGILARETPEVELVCYDNWLIDGNKLDTKSVEHYKGFFAVHTLQLDLVGLEQLWRRFMGMIESPPK